MAVSKEEKFLINWHEMQDVEQLINILSLGIKGFTVTNADIPTKALIKKLKKQNLIKDYEVNSTK
jgi:hypothetical protein